MKHSQNHNDLDNPGYLGVGTVNLGKIRVAHVNISRITKYDVNWAGCDVICVD